MAVKPTPPIRIQLWERDPCCCWCGFMFVDPTFATIEHLQFRSRGGTRTMQNCRLACASCNNEREQWYKRTLRARGMRHDRGGNIRREGFGPMELKPKFVRGAKVRQTVYWPESLFDPLG